MKEKAPQVEKAAARRQSRKTVPDAKHLNLTKDQWRELRLTGCVVARGRIIRTMSFIKGVHRSVGKEIRHTAQKLFTNAERTEVSAQ